ncbi:conserved hypothetical protein [Alkaliphilus metalliredigens QYMF]|uniref:Zinc-ribbon domain-containing protein n=1 Tax=Alkaliphilus metalliredigens (strain QYMF) TaxID=293826 RepID=A6TN03_ALKMQ|nr:hypothetical protein [Alkaliphilus metalliredigens]ABR47571.1 conserved hypothetical protein [Alkaliphilus metalliredigens QYMF]
MSLMEKFMNSASKSAKTMGQKSSEMVEVGKLNMSINKKEDLIQERYEEIGKYVYARLKRYEFVSKEEIGHLITELNTLNRDIEELEKHVLNIKKIKYCTDCKLELEEEAAYCPLCGKLIRNG